MEKQEILKATLQYLSKNPYTQLSALEENVNAILRDKGIIGKKQDHRGGGTYTTTVRISNETALLVNEVIYDLLYKDRVITPGVDNANLRLPFVHVSDLNKLNELLIEE